MTMPEPIKSFWYAFEELGETFVRTPWGVVVSDSRFPFVYDANHAGVLEAAPDLGAAEIRRALLPALRRAGAAHEHFEFMDLADAVPALEELMDESPEHTDPDVTMVYHGDGRALPSPFAVREVVEPDESFWDLHRRSRNEFGDEPLEEPVVEQLVGRDREVMVPAGLRFFAGFAGEEPAGFSSLISLAGVGYVDNVVTMPPFRRRGLAAATVTAAAAASRAAGDRALFLLAEDGGAPQRLYERLGFRVVCRNVGVTLRLPDGR